jgi:hypothetical protein
MTSDEARKEIALAKAENRPANLYGADLFGADLYGADLCCANLRNANLHSADLRSANLRGANLFGANLENVILSAFQIVPEEGAFIGWKKVSRCIIKLEIPADAGRTSSLVGRKCRASHARVLAIEGGVNPEQVDSARGGLVYKVGEVTTADSFDPDIRVECTNGIHFFLTREEAEDY